MRSHHQEMCCRPCCSRSPLRGPGPFAHSHPVLAKTTPWKIHREPQDFCSNHSSRSPTPHPQRRLSVQVGAGRDEDLEAVQLLLHGRPDQWRLALLGVCLRKTGQSAHWGGAWRTHVVRDTGSYIAYLCMWIYIYIYMCVYMCVRACVWRYTHVSIIYIYIMITIYIIIIQYIHACPHNKMWIYHKGGVVLRILGILGISIPILTHEIKQMRWIKHRSQNNLWWSQLSPSTSSASCYTFSYCLMWKCENSHSTSQSYI